MAEVDNDKGLTLHQPLAAPGSCNPPRRRGKRVYLVKLGLPNDCIIRIIPQIRSVQLILTRQTELDSYTPES